MGLKASEPGGIGAAITGWLVVAAVVACLAGCGATDGRYPVEGRLTLETVAIPDTVISFMPQHGGEPGAATTDGDGRFVVSSRARRGLVPGVYDVVVEVVSPPVFRDPDVERPDRTVSRPSKPAVPARYGSRETSELSIEVKPQRNVVSLDLENR